MKSLNKTKKLTELALSQRGMFTVSQAKAIGLGAKQLARMAADGRIENASYGVWRLGTYQSSPTDAIRAAWMSLFPARTAFDRIADAVPDSIVTGATAAYMYGIGDLYPDPYTFSTKEQKRTVRRDIRLLSWGVGDFTVVDALPVASVERTIADLVRLKEDPSLVLDVVKDACANGILTDPARLAELLDPLSDRNGFGRRNGSKFRDALLSRAKQELPAVLAEAVGRSLAAFEGLDADERQTLADQAAESVGGGGR